MYLLGTATSYITLPPKKISVGCGPASSCNLYNPVPFYLLTSARIENGCSHRYAVSHDKRTSRVNLVIRGYLPFGCNKTTRFGCALRYAFESRLPEAQWGNLWVNCLYLHLLLRKAIGCFNYAEYWPSVTSNLLPMSSGRRAMDFSLVCIKDGTRTDKRCHQPLRAVRGDVMVTCFSPRHFGHSSLKSIKTCRNSICFLPFRTVWPNWFNIFRLFKKNSVYNWKKQIMTTSLQSLWHHA